MATQAASEPVVEYNRQLLAEDAAAKGFDKQAWARAADVSDMSVIRLLRGERVGPVTVAKIVAALDQSVERYILRKSADYDGPDRRGGERRGLEHPGDSSSAGESAQAEVTGESSGEKVAS